MANSGLYRDYFNASISNDIQRDIVRHVYKGYIKADKLVKEKEYQPGPAKNLYPYVRWATIDDNCLALNNKYEGLQTSSEINISHNSFHTLITSGNIKMTISSVNNPSALPRVALFRNDLAILQYRFDISKDKSTFELLDLKSISDGTIFAFIIHGPTLDNQRFPGFIHIVFPDEHCTKYLDRIDLFKRFPDLIEELQHEDMIHIPDKAGVKLNVQEKLL
jgi:hypothetical protein